MPAIRLIGRYDCCRGGGEKAWSSDATRFALADAGDFLDDANFAVDTANSVRRARLSPLYYRATLVGVQGGACVS